MKCMQCPRGCGADRINKKGYCGAGGDFCVSRIAPHFWEEPFISGKNGSGAIFFSGCSLRCVFCQNYGISHFINGTSMETYTLIDRIKKLESEGVSNINFVNPTHYSEQLRLLLTKYKPSVPVVWNSGGYEKAEVLRTLEGLVDIYLPDLKYYDAEVSEKYSGAADYFEYASSSVLEMYRQTGPARFDENGMMLGGTVIRHLVLPANVGQAVKIIRWTAENLPHDVYFSLMRQYIPYGRATEFPEINRRLKRKEYDRAVNAVLESGLENVMLQESTAAEAGFIPDFDLCRDSDDKKPETRH